MENEENTEKASEECDLTPGEKFLKEYLEMPYTNDRVGQVFVIWRRDSHIPYNKKDKVVGENPDPKE